MDLFESIKLEEYAGQKFFIEYVSPIPSGNWYRVHTSNGVIHNITIEHADIDKGREEVVQAYKEHLNGGEIE